MGKRFVGGKEEQVRGRVLFCYGREVEVMLCDTTHRQEGVFCFAMGGMALHQPEKNTTLTSRRPTLFFYRVLSFTGFE